MARRSLRGSSHEPEGESTDQDQEDNVGPLPPSQRYVRRLLIRLIGWSDSPSSAESRPGAISMLPEAGRLSRPRRT
jgi:hypothetical protein